MAAPNGSAIPGSPEQTGARAQGSGGSEGLPRQLGAEALPPALRLAPVAHISLQHIRGWSSAPPHNPGGLLGAAPALGVLGKGRVGVPEGRRCAQVRPEGRPRSGGGSKCAQTLLGAPRVPPRPAPVLPHLAPGASDLNNEPEDGSTSKYFCFSLLREFPIGDQSN